MKTLLLASLLLAGTASAQTIATATTNGGSTIRLMAQQGTCSKGWSVFVNVDKATSQATDGCWNLDGDQVIAIYSRSGATYFYDLGHFKMIEQKKPSSQSSSRKGEML